MDDDAGAIEGDTACGGPEETKSIRRARVDSAGWLALRTILDSIRSSLLSRSCRPSRIADNSSRTGAPFLVGAGALPWPDAPLRVPATRRATRSAINFA